MRKRKLILQNLVRARHKGWFNKTSRQVMIYFKSQLRFYETAYDIWKEPAFVTGLKEIIK